MTDETNTVEPLADRMRRYINVATRLGNRTDDPNNAVFMMEEALAAQSQPAATAQEVEREAIARIISLAKGEPERDQTSVGAWWWDARHDRAKPEHFEGECREEDRKHADLMIPLLRAALSPSQSEKMRGAEPIGQITVEPNGEWLLKGWSTNLPAGTQWIYAQPTPAQADAVKEAERRGELRAIARIVNAARAIAWQAGVGGRETAGAIVSYLATSPDEIAPFIAGELSPIDFAGDWMRGGCLTWHAANGKVVSPEDVAALTPKGEAE